MRSLSKVLKYLKNYKLNAALHVFFSVFSVIFGLVSFALFIPVLNMLFQQRRTFTEKPDFDLSTFSTSIKDNFYYQIEKLIERFGAMDALLYIAIVLVILFFLKNFFRYLAKFFLSPIRNGVVRDLRDDLYFKVLILPLSFFTEKKKGDVMARMSNDVQEVEWSIMNSLEMVFREPVTIIGTLIMLVVMSPELTLFVFILLPISGFIISIIGNSLKRTSQKGQKEMGNIISLIEETISGLRIIKAFNAILPINDNFKKNNKDYTKLMIRLFRKRDIASPLTEFLGMIVVAITLIYGGRLILTDGANASIQADAFIVFIVLLASIIAPAKAISSAYYNIQKGAASIDRIEELLNAEEVIIEKPNAVKITDFESEIEYKNVSFRYEEAKVLDNINVKIEKGKTIAIVGSSGAGKSTLVDLLPRFYDCNEGEILIDGRNIKDCIISDVRSLMGIVTQESILFNGSVLDNIAFGMKNVNEEAVIEAAKVANAHEFIVNMTDGYKTNIGDRGAKLSGGQKQRLSIARAILKNPPIMILDEATSALDTESERLVQEALENLMKNRTSVVIAHRLSTIQFADEIIVLDKGKLVERGSHSELLKHDGVYRKLIDMQSFAR